MVRNTITIEGAIIRFRNFSGKEGDFNPAGRRNFCVLLEKEQAQILKEDGWNVRYLKPKDPDDEEQPYLQVTVSFDKYPPKIVMITKKNKTVLNEDTVSALDWAEISNVDLMIRPYNWVRNEGKRNETHGVKAYLKSLYVTIVEDPLESKYRDVPTEGIDDVDGDQPL